MPQIPEVPPIDEPEDMDMVEEPEVFEPAGGETVMSEPVIPPPFEPAPPRAGIPAYAPPPLSSAPAPPPPPAPAAKNKNTTWIIVVIVVVVLLLCCCCIGAVAIFLNSEPGVDLLEELGIAALPFLTAAI